MVPIIPQQRQHKANASKRFNNLIEYLQGEQEQSREGVSAASEIAHEGMELSPLASYSGRPAANEFSELLDYATAAVDTKVQGEKCVGIRTHGVSCIETASAEMNAVSRKNTRVLDPVYHFILSWPEHEKPPHAAIFDAAEHAIRSLGFEEHQYVIAIHANTDNVHAHVALNRVHPITFKSRHIEWAKRTLHFAARESEIKHGWTHDNGIYVVEVDGHGKKQIVLNTKHADANKEQGVHVHPEVERDEALPTWHDPEGLKFWLKTSVSKGLKEEIGDLQTWQALHVWLERYGITLEDTGGGGMRLRAVSPDTGEILELPASQSLRLLKRPELEKRWGAFTAPITNAVSVPDFSNINRREIEKGISRVNRVLGKLPFGTTIPPHHLTGTAIDAEGAVPDGGGGLHELPGGGVAIGDEEPSLPLQSPSQAGMGDGEARQDPGVRSPDPARDAGRQGRVEQGAGDRHLGLAPGRRPRDPEARARRRAERAAARLDLRRRFVQYRAFVADGDTEHFVRLKALRQERSRELTELREEIRIAKAGVSKELDRDVRLVSLAAIDAEATRRRLATNAKYEQRVDALRATRVPPLAWREWLFEQSNRGDKAALSALRGIVYQAKRDAKFDASNDELEDLDSTAIDYHEQQSKRLMARLLAEERKEAAIRAASVHSMRPHEVDALVLSYAGIQWRVTGNGNVEYSRGDGQHLFTDRGNRLTFDRVRVTDDEIQLALVHAREKFGRQLTLTGEDPVFTARMARLANDLGLVVLNPELQPVVLAHREAQRAASGAAAVRVFDRQHEQDHLQPATPVQVDQVITRSVRAEQGASPGDVAPPLAVPEPSPVEANILASDEDRLHALVLAIDPRARFEQADTDDRTRLYVGPIAAMLDDGQPMFAQHVGRGSYVLHRQLAPVAAVGDIVEVRYTGDQTVPAEIRGIGRSGAER
jgi:hypothetical protein